MVDALRANTGGKVERQIRERERERFASAMAQNRREATYSSNSGAFSNKQGGGHVAKDVDHVRVVDRGPEHIDATLLTTFDHLLHVVKQGNARLLAQLLLRKPKFDLMHLDRDFQTCLHHAARYDRVEALQVLLLSSLSLDVNAHGAEGWAPLHTAARFSSVACARLLLQRPDLDVDAVTDLGLTPLHMAAKFSNSVIVSLLLDRGARVDARDNEGRLPIVYAVKNSNTDICSLLHARNSPLLAKDNGGKTPLVMASHAGDVSMMQFLLEIASRTPLESSRMLCEPDFKGMTPLHHAVLSGSQEAVGVLLSANVPIDAQSTTRRTPLFLACQAGNCGLARQLASAGANVNLTDSRGASPLHISAQKQDVNLVELLLDWGADPTAQDAEFRTPLHIACQSGSLPVIRAIAGSRERNLASRDRSMRTCLHLLAARPSAQVAVEALRQLAGSCSAQELRAAVNLGDSHNETALHAAVRADNSELIQLLLELEPDTCVRSTEELEPAELAASLGHLACGRLLLTTVRPSVAGVNNAALLAAQNGHLDFVEYLLGNHRIDVNWTDQFGCSGLMFAVSGGYESIAARLIESGCDVNLQDKSQNTALHYAAKQDSTGACVRILVDSGAELMENCTGEVPLDLAATSGNEAAIEIFLSPEHFETFKAFRRSNGETLFDVLIEHAPKYAMKVLDNSIIKSKCGALDKDFSVTLDFQALDPGPFDQSTSSSYYWATNTMAANMRHDLLTHPVTAVLTLHKWHTFGKYYFCLDIMLYLMFLTTNTAFILDQQPPLPSSLNMKTGCLNGTANGEQKVLGSRRLIFEKYTVLLFVCLRFLLEVIKLISKGYRYFLNTETYFYLALIGSTGVFMWPPSYEPCMYNWTCGVFSIALTWCVFLFQMQSIPHAGIYAMMFQDVLKTLVMALSVFVFLLTGFALSFYISNRSMDPFKTFDASFMKTFDMALGEYEYESYFESVGGIFKPYAQTIFVFFSIIVSVALINLLVGLAVGDIDSIRTNSSTKLIALRVQLLREMQAVFPRWIQKRLHRNTMQLYPNKQRRYKGPLLKWLFSSPYVQEYLDAELLRSLNTEVPRVA